eukprot:jgi/Phyca11/546628/estExt2_Genewise1Plus.C_PHYCAscaffold_220050
MCHSPFSHRQLTQLKTRRGLNGMALCSCICTGIACFPVSSHFAVYFHLSPHSLLSSLRRLCHTDTAERLLRRVLLIARRTQEQRRVAEWLQVATQRAERSGSRTIQHGHITGAGWTCLLLLHRWVISLFPLRLHSSTGHQLVSL